MVGQRDEALRLANLAIEMMEAIVEENPDSRKYRHNLASSHNSLAFILIQKGRFCFVFQTSF